MADTYTSSLRVAQQTVGGNENTWGTTLNASLAMLDCAIAGIVSVSVTGGNVTLTTADNADDQARNGLIILTGTPGTTRTVTFPNVEKLSWVFNNSDSSATLTAGAGTTVTVLAGFTACVYSDGATNMKALFNGSQAVGGQIKFPATQNASADANTLDDYEEGTFTPTLGDGTNNFTLTTADGHYTKIGDRVLGSVDCIWTSIGSAGAGQLRVGALPFTVGKRGALTLSSLNGIDTSATLNQITSGAVVTTAELRFERVNDNAAPTALAANSSNTSGRIIGAFQYGV